MIQSLVILLALMPGDAAVDWRKDYDAAGVEARKTGRLVLLHFILRDRPVCREMDVETFAKAEVIQAIRERFIAVRADIESESTLFAATVGGRGGLATCVLDADGDVIAARNGYAGPQDFLKFLEKADAGHGRIKAAREALSTEPESPGRLLALGEAYREGDSLRRAEDCYLRVIESAKLRGDAGARGAAATAQERMARLRVMRGRNLESRKHLEEARRLDPEGRNAPKDRLLLSEGLVLAVERRNADAAKLLRDALQRYPASEEADQMLYTLGFVLHQDSLDKPALEILESIAPRYPRSAWLAAAREQIEHIRNPQPDHVH
jgi:tetratricopeptide (TPR) repeat protein